MEISINEGLMRGKDVASSRNRKAGVVRTSLLVHLMFVVFQMYYICSYNTHGDNSLSAIF